MCIYNLKMPEDQDSDHLQDSNISTEILQMMIADEEGHLRELDIIEM